MIRVEVFGLDEVIEATEDLIGDLQRGDVFEAAARTHRMALVPAARAEAPRVTGRLVNSIKTTLRDNVLSVEATADHAGYVHEGTSRQNANPFLDRAIRRLNPDLEKRIETEIAKRYK